MIIYILKGIEVDAEYDDEDFILGVFSSQEKAIAARESEISQDYFSDLDFDIEEWELDDYSWERVP